MPRAWLRDLCIWLLFLCICFGLGYASLNRFDPRRVRGTTSDSIYYYPLVTRGPLPHEFHPNYRILLPSLARPLYHLADGRVGTWNPVFFALLIVSSLFTAGTGYLLVLTARVWSTASIALLAALVYLLTFDVGNTKLMGNVDSAEGFFLMAVVWILSTRRYPLLLLCGVLGALAKETFVPLSAAIVFGWEAAEWLRTRTIDRARLAWPAAMIFAGLVSISSVHSIVDRQVLWPWQFAAGFNSHTNYLRNLLHSFADRNLIYEYAWLLPLGLIRIHRMPRPWVVGCAASIAVAFCLNAYFNGQPGTVGRAAHSIAGPLLSLAIADWIQPRLAPVKS